MKLEKPDATYLSREDCDRLVIMRRAIEACGWYNEWGPPIINGQPRPMWGTYFPFYHGGAEHATAK